MENCQENMVSIWNINMKLPKFGPSNWFWVINIESNSRIVPFKTIDAGNRAIDLCSWIFESARMAKRGTVYASVEQEQEWLMYSNIVIFQC